MKKRFTEEQIVRMLREAEWQQISYTGHHRERNNSVRTRSAGVHERFPLIRMSGTSQAQTVVAAPENLKNWSLQARRDTHLRPAAPPPCCASGNQPSGTAKPRFTAGRAIIVSYHRRTLG